MSKRCILGVYLSHIQVMTKVVRTVVQVRARRSAVLSSFTLGVKLRFSHLLKKGKGSVLVEVELNILQT